MTYAEIEASRRKSAEASANKLRAQIERLRGQHGSEIAARESAESGRRAAEYDARSYRTLHLEATVAWQYTQGIVENKEKDITTMEERQRKVRGDFRLLQGRLHGARKGKEMNKELPIVI